MGKLVIIYTLNHCSYCTKLKKMCDKEGIVYISKDIEDRMHEKEYLVMKKRSNNDLIPLIRVGNKLLVADVHFDKIPEAIVKIKELI